MRDTVVLYFLLNENYTYPKKNKKSNPEKDMISLAQ